MLDTKYNLVFSVVELKTQNNKSTISFLYFLIFRINRIKTKLVEFF